MKIAVNPNKILNLIEAEKKVKVLMMELKQNKKKSRRRRKLSKQGSLNKKRFSKERNN